MAFVATTSATAVVPPPEFTRKKPDPSGDYQHEGSVFVTTANKKGCYIIHPDWVSEEQRPAGNKPSSSKPRKCLDNTGVQRGHYVIAPDWVSEGSKFPRFDNGRSHKPWPFEFKGARHWPDQSLDRRPPSVRASWGGEGGSRPPTGIHLVEHNSGWMPITSRQAIMASKGDRMPSYSYNRAYSTSYGEQFSRTALGAFAGPAPEPAKSAMPWRSYNSWNIYSQELARSRRDAPPRPSYMLPSASSWVP